MPIAEESSRRLQEKFISHESSVIFNTDKCGLNYRIEPDLTGAYTALPGQFKGKDRIYVFPCCNADRTKTLNSWWSVAPKRRQFFNILDVILVWKTIKKTKIGCAPHRFSIGYGDSTSIYPNLLSDWRYYSKTTLALTEATVLFQKCVTRAYNFCDQTLQLECSFLMPA